MPQKNREERKQHGISRRKFAEKAGLAGVAAIFGASTVSAVPNARESTAQSENSASHGSSDIHAAELEAKFQRVMLHYGNRLSAEQQAHIRNILEQNEKMMQPIREFHLENGQGTATALKLCPDPAVLLAHATSAHATKETRKN
jgi:transcriptional regulator with XRE-family HTH domain